MAERRQMNQWRSCVTDRAMIVENVTLARDMHFRDSERLECPESIEKLVAGNDAAVQSAGMVF